MTEACIRILTANLLQGRADAAALAALVVRHDVHVVAVQELGPGQVPPLAAVLPHGKLEPASDFNGMGIALRWPGDVGRLPLRHRDARVARLTPGEWPHLTAPVEVVNVHLQAPHAGWPWVAFGRRRAQVARLSRYLADAAGPRVILGDLNATPAWPAYRRLARHAADAVTLHAARSGARPRRTWGPWPGAPRLLRIDHVLACGLVPTHAQTLELPGSDHHAVLVELAAPGSDGSTWPDDRPGGRAEPSSDRRPGRWRGRASRRCRDAP